MSRRSATLRGRRFAEPGFLDTCTIKRPTGTTTNSDGAASSTFAAVYSGKCRIQTNDPYESRPAAGEHLGTVLRDILQVPMSVTGVQPDDVVEVTASELDPDLVGRVWRVAGPSRKTHQTMRRFYIAESQVVS